MSYLIFCSFEVGGLPFKMAEILNRHGIDTFYVSLQTGSADHNSTQFHYGKRDEPWDVSSLFAGNHMTPTMIVQILKKIREEYRISHCLATGSKASLLLRAGISYNYWSFGADLDQDCFCPYWAIDYPLWKKLLVNLKFIATTKPTQRVSICSSDAVMIAPYQLDALQKVCSDKRLFFFPHFLEIPDFNEVMSRREKSRKEVSALIGADHYFFSTARHFWGGRHAEFSDNKGNDVILRAFAAYRRMTDEHVKLVLIRKGPDVDASQRLAEELGIGRFIYWMDEVKRGDLEKYYQGASVCFGQFGTPVISFATLEPLTWATPCISYYETPPPNFPFYREMPPLINSRDPIVIAAHLQRLMTSSEYYESLCSRSWHWVKEHCSEEKFAQEFVGIFAGKHLE